MKNIFIVISLLAIFFSSGFSGSVCLKVIKKMDKEALSDSYKQIAWYTYKHKMKLDYILKNYQLLAKVRNSNSSDMETNSATSTNIVSMPTIQMASSEAEIIAEINTVNIALLDLLLYRSIKSEIKESIKNN